MALPSPLANISAHLRWLYPLAVVVSAAVLGYFLGLGLALLILAGGVLVGCIWMIWSSLQGLGGDVPLTLDEALSLGAPSAEEEQKRAVLRALKDLEYERTVGKISEEDYASLAEQYRREAKRLLRAVDKDLSSERERAERILAERLAAVNGKRPAAKRPADVASDEVAADLRSEDDAAEASAPVKSPPSDTAP